MTHEFLVEFLSIFLIVSSLCLKPKEDPAFCKILYSGLNLFKKYCYLFIISSLEQYSNISNVKFE